MNRPVVLVFVHYYLPGYKAGGPVRSIANMADHLGDEFEFRIVTSDRDLGDSVAYAGVTSGQWTSVGKASVMYVAPRQQGIGGFARLMRTTPHDMVHLNSFFEPVFAAVPLLLRRLGRVPRTPCMLAPRGEFSPGALALKTWKKKPYLGMLRTCGLARDVLWQASSAHEAADIVDALGVAKGRILVAPNPPAAPSGTPDPGMSRRPGSALRLLFLSRISPKKNLHGALRMLARIRVPAEFDIYGPIGDEDYWRRCQADIAALPAHVRVSHHGAVPPERIGDIMGRHDLFFLPTLGENYGHVIAEALSAGTPVLIADTTPWRGLEAAGVGWDLPLEDEGGFQRAIEHCARLDAGAWSAWRGSIRRYAAQRLHDPAVVEANRALLRAALSGAPA